MPKKGKEEEIDSTVLGKKTKRQKKQKKPNNKENSKNIQFLNSLQQGKLKATNLPNVYYFNMSKSTGSLNYLYILDNYNYQYINNSYITSK